MTSEKKPESKTEPKKPTGGRLNPMTFSVVTLGCKVNQYESEAIIRGLISSGFCKTEQRQTGSSKKSDLCIVNTCTVTAKASMQSRQAIRKAIRDNPAATIIVTGCLAQTAPEEIQAIDGVHCIVGQAVKHRIQEIVSDILIGGTPPPKLIHNDIRQNRRFMDMHHEALDSRTRPFLKIQDGCNAGCTYCIVPRARGPHRSMPTKQVIEHVLRIQTAGYHEIVLTGIHLGRYGSDLSPKIQLSDLLKILCENEAVDRIRLSSIEPLEVTPALIGLAAQAGRRPGQICPHFHIPLQSGDNDILRRMHRPYRREDFAGVVHQIVSAMPFAAVGADVLIGFPGETEEAFCNTMQLIAELPLAYLHVFPFSPRQGTAAAEFPDRVPPQIIKERCRRVRMLGFQKRNAFIRRWLQRDVEVLVEGERDAASGMLKGITPNYIRVLVAGEDRLQNTFQTVQIEDILDERTLLGRVKRCVSKITN